MEGPEDFELEGEVTLFGFDSVPAQAGITPRSRAWRVGGALRTMAIFVVIAPFVAIIPPHAVWFIGALLAGAFLARKRYIERFTHAAGGQLSEVRRRVRHQVTAPPDSTPRVVR